jgi:hypothetical protein
MTRRSSDPVKGAFQSERELRNSKKWLVYKTKSSFTARSTSSESTCMGKDADEIIILAQLVRSARNPVYLLSSVDNNNFNPTSGKLGS